MYIEFGILGAIFGLAISFLTFNRNRDKDLKDKATNDAVISTKLDSIGSSVESIRVDTKVTGRRLEEMSERVIRVEESAKQAHKRLDNVEGRGMN